jgi:hypothetical protein
MPDSFLKISGIMFGYLKKMETLLLLVIFLNMFGYLNKMKSRNFGHVDIRFGLVAFAIKFYCEKKCIQKNLE